MNMVRYKQVRVDCFLVWGHGMPNLKSIIDIISNDELFNIKLVYRKDVSNIKKFIKKIYSFDYAPWHHLKSKTKYLQKSPKTVCFIFVENLEPDPDYVDVGQFRHQECKNVKRIKNIIRDKFNPYNNGKITHEHVIHATDNQSQTLDMFQIAGFKKEEFNRIFGRETMFPWFLPDVKKYEVKEVLTKELYCKNIVNGVVETLSLDKSRQFLGLKEDVKIYQDYLDENIGIGLVSYYSTKKLLKLQEGFEYLKPGYDTQYIVVRNENNRLVIVDGLHRAAICLFKGVSNLKVCEIYE
ncbi:hypothetical protein DX883_12290 [Vibrio fluvialis]|nr:hypothetical protein [Vibrio fluvialis]